MNITSPPYLCAMYRLFLICLLGLGCGGDRPKVAGDAAVQPVTSAELRQLVTQSGAQAVLVNIWATWCGPCREEFPDLLRLEREWRDKGLKVLLVSADLESEFPSAKRFLAEQGVTFTTYWKAEKDSAFMAGLDARWSGALPATFIYDRTGQLRAFWEGKADYAKLAEQVGAILAHP